MDDILRTIMESLIENKLSEINSLHPNLKFLLEVEQNDKLPFLDICIERHENMPPFTWYCKSADTGLILNFHAMAPKSYKRSVIQGFVYRIYRACSSWKKIHEGLIKAKDILERNQYPPNFYELIISASTENIVKPSIEKVNNADVNNKNLPAKVNLIIQYIGLPTDNFIKQLKCSNTSIQPVATLQKQTTFLPSLKPNLKEELRSSVVYKMTFPGCHACYVGQTSQHMPTCFKEHSNHKNKPVRKHFDLCIGAKLQTSDVRILASLN